MMSLGSRCSRHLVFLRAFVNSSSRLEDAACRGSLEFFTRLLGCLLEFHVDTVKLERRNLRFLLMLLKLKMGRVGRRKEWAGVFGEWIAAGSKENE